MRNYASDVVDRQSRLVERFFGCVDHGGDRLLVNFLSDHVDGVQIKIDIVAGDRAARATARHEKDVTELSIASDVCADYAMGAAAMAQDSRASAVAKKDASITIGPVCD